MKKILIINAHQHYDWAEGKLNETMVNVIKKECETKAYEVKLTKVEDGYDIVEEVAKHEWADIIITQAPVYWFATPWIHKKYIDEVLTSPEAMVSLFADDGRTRKNPSKQYGTGGKMQDKKYMLSLTWNAPKEAFNDKAQYMLEGRSVDEVFYNNTAPYKFCGAEILPVFSCYDVIKAPQIESDIQRLKAHLNNIL